MHMNSKFFVITQDGLKGCCQENRLYRSTRTFDLVTYFNCGKHSHSSYSLVRQCMLVIPQPCVNSPDRLAFVRNGSLAVIISRHYVQMYLRKIQGSLEERRVLQSVREPRFRERILSLVLVNRQTVQRHDRNNFVFKKSVNRGRQIP